MAADQDDERKPPASPADVLRDAVERTFREAAGNVAGAGTRAQSLLDDAAAAIARLRESSGDDAPAPTSVDTLTARVDALTKRVEALEAARPQKPAP